MRDEVAKLEAARAAKRIGSSLESTVTIDAPDELRAFLASFGPGLRFLFLTSGVAFDRIVLPGAAASAERTVFRSEELQATVEVLRSGGTKCERCWNYTADVGSVASWPGICGRCAGNVRSILAETS